MINESKKIVKFNDLSDEAMENCIRQFFGIIAWESEEIQKHLYEELGCYGVDVVVPTRKVFGKDIDLFVEATPDQFYFDENGDWYDEGRKVRA